MYIEKLGYVFGKEIILVFLVIGLEIYFRIVLNRDCNV